MVAPRVFIT